MNDTLETLMFGQSENCVFSDKRIHLNVILHYQVREGKVGLLAKVLGN